MLSKIFHYESDKDLPNIDIETLMIRFKAYFEDKKQTVKVFKNQASGTLGVFFNMVIDRKSYFVKTHLASSIHRTNLIKEIVILEHLYRDILEIKRIDLNVNGFEYTFLVMDELMTLTYQPDMSTIHQLVKEYNLKLKDFEINKSTGDLLLIDHHYRFSKLQELSVNAAKLLMEHKLLSIKIGNQIKDYLVEGVSKFTEEPIICHGDLSNKNILLHNDQMIVVDWEDAFIGTEGYDYYYWLTFFDQRIYYGTDEFYHLCSDNDKCKYIMILVVTLKCYLSVINNSYKNNTLSFDKRFEEMLNLFN